MFCRGENKQENRPHAKCLDWYTSSARIPVNSSAIHHEITGQPISRSINILKDVEFTQANKMFEVVCKSYYKGGNPKPQHKTDPIEAGDMEKLNSYFSNDCPDKLQEFVRFNFGPEREGRLARTYKELARVQAQRSKQRVCHYKAYRTNQEQSRWF